MRRGLGALAVCLLGLAAAPAVAADKAEDSSTLEDIVDGVGGFLKVLVGPPISSPSPYLNLPGTETETGPVETRPVEAVAAPPPPPPPVAPAPSVAAPAVVPLPAVVPVRIPAPPPVKAAAPVPPPPKPAVPVPAAAPVPAAVPAEQPACALRVAATATIEQMRRLPSCK